MSAQPQTGPTDNRALLSSIGSRRVRNVAGEVSRFAEALYAVVLDRKPRGEPWQNDEWAAVLEELDTCELTVAEFLRQEFERRAVRQ